MTLTPDSILALATDPGSASNGRKLATPGKWQHLNAPAGMLWGQCQGSGQDPYLVGVDLSGPVSRCSCPSRKFPCKHGLALMLLYVSHRAGFGTAEAPESLQAWVRGREQRASAAEAKGPEAGESTKREADPAAQARRRTARERKVTGGLAALHVFLKDLVRDGLAHAGARPYSDWDTLAARLMDAQAPGAARQVRAIPERLGDPAALLAHLGRLALLCEGWAHRERLSDAELADLKTALGFPLDQAALLAGAGIRATWTVLGQTRAQEDHLTVRRTWLWSGPHTALLLDFAPAGRPLPAGLGVGQSVRAELCFAPSNAPQRAVLRGEAELTAPLAPPPGAGWEALLDAHASALSLNPWLDRGGHTLGPVRLAPGPRWAAVDASGRHLPLAGAETALFQLLALGGGAPQTLFGEWDGRAFVPLSVLDAGGVTPLRQEAGA